jgi:neurotransmitter:Na+ symporter, NSS family
MERSAFTKALFMPNSSVFCALSTHLNRTNPVWGAQKDENAQNQPQGLFFMSETLGQPDKGTDLSDVKLANGSKRPRETWNTQLGVILAVMGSAVGLGNFLRFPGLAAKYGGGAFMIPYITAFLLLGLPLAWVEWSMGRYGGSLGYNSAPGIYRKVWKSRMSPYFGILAILIPVMIYMYYVYIEAWCLAYSFRYIAGAMDPETIRTYVGAEAGAPNSELYSSFFGIFTGADRGGGLKIFSGNLLDSAGFFLVLCFIINFTLIYRGLTKGIEWFCKWAMPILVICALIVLFRVLTLGTPDPNLPDQNLSKGMGYMWNPIATEAEADPEATDPVATDPEVEGSGEKVVPAGETMGKKPKYGLAALIDPEIWLVAAGQIFFSLSVGFGIIITYSSYMKKDDDIALASLTAASGNGFFEVVLGGMITIPAAFVFLGPTFIANLRSADDVSSFSLGFQTLPHVFNEMGPSGPFIGFCFFFLLFLAAVTSSLSMLQPAIALLEEGLGLNRKASVALLGLITACGAGFIIALGEGHSALGTVDFWVGSLCLFVLGTFQVIIFAWVLGIERGMDELKRGAEMKIPNFVKYVIKYVSPVYLIVVFVAWIYMKFIYPYLFGTQQDIDTSPVGQILGNNLVLATFGFIIALAFFFWLLVAQSVKRWERLEAEEEAAKNDNAKDASEKETTS